MTETEIFAFVPLGVEKIFQGCKSIEYTCRAFALLLFDVSQFRTTSPKIFLKYSQSYCFILEFCLKLILQLHEKWNLKFQMTIH